MPKFNIKNCEVCSDTFQPSGPCARFCPACREAQRKLRQREGQAAYRARKGLPVGVGKGGSTPTFTAHSQFSTGIGNFHRLRKEMRETILNCERCSADLSDASRYHWTVHHRDHDRTNNVRENLEMLCKRCHQVHHDCAANLAH